MQDKEDMFFMTCSCGCNNGLLFRYMDETIYVSAVQGIFMSGQHSIIASLRDKARLLAGRNPWIMGVCTNRQEADALLAWLRAHPCAHASSYRNSSELRLEHELISRAEIESYDMVLYSRLSPFEIIAGKEFRAGELAIYEEKRKKMIRQMAHALRYPDRLSMSGRPLRRVIMEHDPGTEL